MGWNTWRKLCDNKGPTNRELAKTWGYESSYVKEILGGRKRQGSFQELATKALELRMPTRARVYLEAMARGAPPDKLEELAARLQQKGPGESLEESPSHSQAQDSAVRPTAPLKATKLLDDFRSGAAAHMTFKEFSDQVSACAQNPWKFTLLSGLWQDLKKALVGVYSADEFRAATPTATIRALRSEGADQLADYWRALARNHQDCDTNSNLWRAVWASDLAEGLIRAHYQEWTLDEKARCEHDWLFAKDGRASVAKACLRVFEAAPV